MGETNTTRTIRSYGPDNIYVEGLTKGPAAGWEWDGQTLSHPMGIHLRMTPVAAARITAAVAAYVPPTRKSLTGVELARLPEADRDRYELVSHGWGENKHDNEHTWRWVCSTASIPGVCEIDIADVVNTNIRRG